MPKSAGTDLWSRTPINDRPAGKAVDPSGRPGTKELAQNAEVQRYIDAGASSDMKPLCIGIPNGRPCVRPVKNTKSAYCKECEDD